MLTLLLFLLFLLVMSGVAGLAFEVGRAGPQVPRAVAPPPVGTELPATFAPVGDPVEAGKEFAIREDGAPERFAALSSRTSLENRGQLGAPRPTALLPVLLNEIARGEIGPVCDVLIAAPARAAFAAAAGQPDCPAAVRALAAQVRDRSDYAKARAPGVDRGDVREIDACRMTWRGALAPPGPQLGHLTVGRAEGGRTWVVTGFRPC